LVALSFGLRYIFFQDLGIELKQIRLAWDRENTSHVPSLRYPIFAFYELCHLYAKTNDTVDIGFRALTRTQYFTDLKFKN
jgi:hypothetical protein